MRGAGFPDLCKIGLHDPSQRVKGFLVSRLGFDILCLDCGRVRDVTEDPPMWRHPSPEHVRAVDEQTRRWA